jgi:hypothetical protein
MSYDVFINRIELRVTDVSHEQWDPYAFRNVGILCRVEEEANLRRIQNPYCSTHWRPLYFAHWTSAIEELGPEEISDEHKRHLIKLLTIVEADNRLWLTQE